MSSWKKSRCQSGYMNSQSRKALVNGAVEMNELDRALYWSGKEDIAFIYCQTNPEKKVWINDWPNLDFTKFDFADKTYAERWNFKKYNINGIAIVLGQTIHKQYYVFALDFDGWDAVEKWFGS